MASLVRFAQGTAWGDAAHDAPILRVVTSAHSRDPPTLSGQAAGQDAGLPVGAALVVLVLVVVVVVLDGGAVRQVDV